MLQAVHGWSSTYERFVKSQKFFSSYLTQEDLSRLGRNYIEVGRLTEEFFPDHDIRLVAVSDNIDTADGRPVFHFDFYRIDRIEEAYDFGYEEYFYSGNLCLVEWPEKIEELLPDDTMTVRIRVDGPEQRTLFID